MIDNRFHRVASWMVVALVVLGAVSFSARAASAQAGEPVVTVAPDEAAPTDRVTVSIVGFQSQSVTISICGNEARRGSSDCNMAESEGLRVDPGETTVQIPLASPPVPCPCVVRVSDRTNDEVAIVPLRLLGHPIGPIIDPSPIALRLAVEVTVAPADDGALATAIARVGGRSSYEVTVTVRNESDVALNNVIVLGSVGRTIDDNLADVALPNPPTLLASQVWEHTTFIDVPGPTLRALTWKVTASAEGVATASASTQTSRRPWLLMVLVGVVVADVGILAMRASVRRRRKARIGTVSSQDEMVETNDHEPTRYSGPVVVST